MSIFLPGGEQMSEMNITRSCFAFLLLFPICPAIFIPGKTRLGVALPLPMEPCCLPRQFNPCAQKWWISVEDQSGNQPLLAVKNSAKPVERSQTERATRNVQMNNLLVCNSCEENMPTTAFHLDTYMIWIHGFSILSCVPIVWLHLI